jgi:hypothetical protein
LISLVANVGQVPLKHKMANMRKSNFILCVHFNSEFKAINYQALNLKPSRIYALYTLVSTFLWCFFLARRLPIVCKHLLESLTQGIYYLAGGRVLRAQTESASVCCLTERLRLRSNCAFPLALMTSAELSHCIMVSGGGGRRQAAPPFNF